MVTVPAFVWRYGPLLRGVILGVAVGGFLGALAWIDSGLFLVGVIAFVILFVFYGGWMSRRMARQWPSAARLSGSEREQVATAARGGLPIEDADLLPALIDYRNGLHDAADTSRWFRWVIWFVLVVAVCTAVYDGLFGSWGNLVVSAVYLVMLLVEVFWWPKRLQQLLVNSDRAVDMAKSSD
jgi:uncharacterized membrane protein YfcA